MNEFRDGLSREVDLERKAMLADMELTNLKKRAFINEIKCGLGDDIKKNPNKVKIEKQTKKKLSNFFKNLFTKF
jgi:hypothetical protein